MYRLNDEIKERLIARAKNYKEDELYLFQCELGWEDWMDEFTEAGDGEELTEAECNAIDKVTAEIFAEAHK